MSELEEMLKEAESARVVIAPRFIRIPDAELMFGLKRSKLIELARQGKVTSLSLRENGMDKGVRLFEVASIDRYIRSFIKKDGE